MSAPPADLQPQHSPDAIAFMADIRAWHDWHKTHPAAPVPERLHISPVRLHGTPDSKASQIESLAALIGTRTRTLANGVIEAAVWHGRIGYGAWLDPHITQRMTGTYGTQHDLETETAALTTLREAGLIA